MDDDPSRPMNPAAFASTSLKPFLAQVAHVVEEHERLLAENLRLKANKDHQWAFLDSELDEILKERCEIKKDLEKARVKSKDAPRFEDATFSVVPELSGIQEASIEETQTFQTDVAEGSKKAMAQAVFQNSADMKQAVRAELMKDGKGYDVKNFYKQKGCSQQIARSPLFEHITMLVIGVYAIWMAIDTDLNPSDVITDAPPFFFAVEQIFCAYFLVELVIRFAAFEEKRNCLRDAWFLFDLALVFMMVLENWVMTVVLLATGLGDTDGILANANILRLARLMRLTRLLRMARLLRMVPELLILVKAIAAAMRSVGFTLVLLILMLYVFGIGFTQILKGTDLGSPEGSFSGVLLSMQTLYLRITLLDNISELFDSFMQEEQWLAFALLYSFLIMSAITVANMLIGVICEVITAVAAAEKEAIQITFVKDTLLRVMGRSDANFDGRLQKGEFFKIARDKQAVKALKELGVDMITLIDFADIIFENASESEDNGSEELSFSEFMEVILQFRGSNTATVKDMVDFRKWFTVQYRQMLREDMEAILNGKVKGSSSLNRRQQMGGLRQTILSGSAHRWLPPQQGDDNHVSVNL